MGVEVAVRGQDSDCLCHDIWSGEGALMVFPQGSDQRGEGKVQECHLHPLQVYNSGVTLAQHRSSWDNISYVGFLPSHQCLPWTAREVVGFSNKGKFVSFCCTASLVVLIHSCKLSPVPGLGILSANQEGALSTGKKHQVFFTVCLQSSINNFSTFL